MSKFHEEPLADVSDDEWPVQSNSLLGAASGDEPGDDPSDDSKDDSKDELTEDFKSATKCVDAVQKGFTLFTSKRRAENEKKKKEALDALVKEVPKLEAKIEQQSAYVDALKGQSEALLAAIQHNYELITNTQNMVEQQSNVIDSKFISVEIKLNVVLSRIDRAKQVILQHIGDLEADIISQHRNRPKIEVINRLNNAFAFVIEQVTGFKSLPLDEKVSSFDSNEGEPSSLEKFEQMRIPLTTDGVYNSVWDIINQNWAIPRDEYDEVSIIALNILCFSMYFYGYLLHYMLEQYSQMLEYYRLNTNLESYNRCYWKKLNVLNDFAGTLIGSNGFYPRVEAILTQIKNLDYIQIYRKDVEHFAIANIENIGEYRAALRKLRRSFMNARPEVLKPNLDFTSSNTTTIDDYHATNYWAKGIRVSYAIQLLSHNMTTSSLVSKWSAGYTLEDKANPIVKVPHDPLNRTRVVFRRFEGIKSNSQPKIVAILKDPKQTEFRDIDRDLYDYAEQSNLRISLAKVKYYLENGANANAVLEYGQVALHVAAHNRRHGEVATELIKHGANVDAQNVEGYTPLAIATEKGFSQFVAKLLEHNANVTLATSDKHHRLTPLQIASYMGHIGIVKMLLQASGLDVNARSIEGFTALHFAAAFDYDKIVSLLLEDKRTEIDPKSYIRVAVPGRIKSMNNNIGKVSEILATSARVTPLHLAYAVGNEKVVTQLLAKGADINARTSDGSTVMHFAATNDNVKLIPDSCENSAIFNSPNVYDLTPLYVAFQNNHIAMAAKFLKQCGDINVRLSNQKTMLHIAVQSDDIDVAKKLIDNGISVDAVDSNGTQPLHYAIYLRNLEMADALLSRNANADALDSDGDPIVYSIFTQMNKIDGARMLEKFIENKLNVNIVDRNKNTLLHYASAFDYENAANLLLKHPSINVNVANEQNETPLHLALINGNEKIADILFENHASVTVKGRGDWTAVNYAIAGKLDTEKTVSFVGKFLPITKECEDHEVLFDINILQASEYFKSEVVKFYIEKCGLDDWEEIPPSYLGIIGGHGNAKVLKDLFPWIQIVLYFGCDSVQVLIFDALKGNTNFEVIQFLVNHPPYKLAADYNLRQEFPNNTNWHAMNYTIMGKGDLQIIQFITETAFGEITFPPLHAPYDEKENLMHLAAKANKSEIALYLREKGVALNDVDKYGCLPLHYAARNGDIAMVRFLLVDKNGNVDKTYIDKKNDAENTPLMEAVWNDGNLNVVKFLVDNKADIDESVVKDGWTLVNKAAQLDKTYVAIHLCESLKNANRCAIRNSDQISPMHFAAANNNINLVEFFISKKISVQVKDKWNITPIYYAIRERGQLQMVKYLHRHFPSPKIEMTNVENEENWIGLAISRGKYDIAKYLIAQGADVQKPGKSRKTPLHEAVLADRGDLIQLLIQKGADCFYKDGKDKTAIDWTFEYRKDQALQYFIFNYQDKQNGSLMHERTLANDPAGVQWLVERGGNVNSQDKDKSTPLHLAAENGYKNVVAQLIKSKCVQFLTKNEKGQTALDVAEANHHKELIRFGQEDIVDIIKNRQLRGDVSEADELLQNAIKHNYDLLNHDLIRKQREVEQEFHPTHVASAAGRSSGLINRAIESFVSVLKAVPVQLSNLVSLRQDNPNARNSVPHSGFKSFESPDLNSSLLLLDLIIRKNSGQPYVNTTLVQSASPLEARMFALSLVEQMQSALDQLAEKSVQNQVELDWFDLCRTVEGLALSGQYEPIESLMHSTARKALPSEAIDSSLLVEMVEGVMNQLTTGQTRETQLAGLHSFSSEIAAKTGPQVRSKLDGNSKHHLI